MCGRRGGSRLFVFYFPSFYLMCFILSSFPSSLGFVCSCDQCAQVPGVDIVSLYHFLPLFLKIKCVCALPHGMVCVRTACGSQLSLWALGNTSVYSHIWPLQGSQGLNPGPHASAVGFLYQLSHIPRPHFSNFLRNISDIKERWGCDCPHTTSWTYCQCPSLSFITNSQALFRHILLTN